MSRTSYTDGAPWLGKTPFSAAVKVGDLVFLAGHNAINADGSIEHAGDVAAQARLAFERLLFNLDQAGGSVDDLVDLMAFTADPRQIEAVIEVGREFLPKGEEPAWTAAGSTGGVSPDALVTLRGIAVLGKVPKQCIIPDSSWWTGLPAAAACKKGDLVFVSGQVSVDSDGTIVEPGSHRGQANEAMAHVRRLLELAGGSLDDMLDMVSFHHDVRGMSDAAAAFEAAFEGVGPSEASALTTIGTPGLSSPGMMGSYRAIADLSAGPRVARVPDTVWWKSLPIAGVVKKESGTLVGIAGQVSSDGEGEILHAGDVRAQAAYCFQQLGDGLEMLGGSIADIVEVTAYHKDPRDWEVVSDVAAGVFGDERPAWTSVGTTGLYQEGYLHEIHALAVIE
jgi:enamine deaminase RidA (YjgF/YER057c/UK114 family)